MKVVIRVDASLQIGSGHVMRCLTLADELRSRGADILFISRDHPGNLFDLIKGQGYPLACLAAAAGEYQASADDPLHAHWMGVSWERDAEETVAALPAGRADLLTVDHYAVDRRWEGRLRPHVGRIMVIDDLADRPHDCDLLLDQNLYRDMESRYNGLVPDACHKLVGPRYALLRPEFTKARRTLRQRDGQVRRILVFFGGVDADNQTDKALQVLSALGRKDLVVDVVVGGANPHKDEIKAVCRTNGFDYHCQVGNMAELMAAADLAIGGGGTATWERCAVGLPALVVSIAENQYEIAHNACQVGAIIFLGNSFDLDSAAYQDKLLDTVADSHIIRTMADKAIQLVDGNGAERTVDAMVVL